MIPLRILMAVLLLLGGSLTAGAAQFRITATLTVTNGTSTNGDMITINTATRNWTNSGSSTTILATNSVAHTTTNLYNHLLAYPVTNVTVTLNGTNVITFFGGLNATLLVRPTNTWATVVYRTNVITTQYPVVVPFAAETAGFRTHMISNLIEAINAQSVVPFTARLSNNVLAARTLFVATNGNDAIAVRESLTHPFATAAAAKEAANAGDTIVVRAGTHAANTNLAKNDVTWWLDPGAILLSTNWQTNMFRDDGLITNVTIAGPGKLAANYGFTYLIGTNLATNVNGLPINSFQTEKPFALILQTNNSTFRIDVGEIEMDGGVATNNSNLGGTVFQRNGRMFLRAQTMRSTNDLGTSMFWWEGGDFYGDVQRAVAWTPVGGTNYGALFYGTIASDTQTNHWYYTGEEVDAGLIARHDEGRAARLWFNVKQFFVRNGDSEGNSTGAGFDMRKGLWYVDNQKMFVLSTNGNAIKMTSASSAQPTSLYWRGQKIEGGGTINAMAQLTGDYWVEIDEWHDRHGARRFITHTSSGSVSSGQRRHIAFKSMWASGLNTTTNFSFIETVSSNDLRTPVFISGGALIMSNANINSAAVAILLNNTNTVLDNITVIGSAGTQKAVGGTVNTRAVIKGSLTANIPVDSTITLESGTFQHKGTNWQTAPLAQLNSNHVANTQTNLGIQRIAFATGIPVSTNGQDVTVAITGWNTIASRATNLTVFLTNPPTSGDWPVGLPLITLSDTGEVVATNTVPYFAAREFSAFSASLGLSQSTFPFYFSNAAFSGITRPFPTATDGSQNTWHLTSSNNTLVILSHNRLGLSNASFVSKLNLTNSVTLSADPVNGVDTSALAGEWLYRTSATSEGAGQVNRLHNRAAEIVGSGSDYSITGSTAQIDFGGTDVEFNTLPSAGTYLITAVVTVTAGGTGGDTYNFKLRNATAAADITGSAQSVTKSAGEKFQVLLQSVATFTSADRVQLFGHNSTAARGTVNATETKLVYVRLH